MNRRTTALLSIYVFAQSDPYALGNFDHVVSQPAPGGDTNDAVRFWEAQMSQSSTATEHVPAAGPNANAANATAYDLQGRPVREGYRGIIIQNGNKYISR